MNAGIKREILEVPRLQATVKPRPLADDRQRQTQPIVRSNVPPDHQSISGRGSKDRRSCAVGWLALSQQPQPSFAVSMLGRLAVQRLASPDQPPASLATDPEPHYSDDPTKRTAV